MSAMRADASATGTTRPCALRPCTAPWRTAPWRTASGHAPRALPRRAGARPWIAMYHSVADGTDDPYRVTVSPGRLEEQLGRLRRWGLRGVGVAELLAARAVGADRNLVGLTFDDGYLDFAENAVPLLRAHGCSATVFVLPGRLGGENGWDPLGPRRPLLDAAAVRRVADAGMEIASHGLSHTDLTRVDGTRLTAEVAESRARLAEVTGRPVHGFCYPYGAVDRRVADAVRRAGYRYACATAPDRLLSGLFALPRVHLGQDDTVWRLTAKRHLAPLYRPLPPIPFPGPAPDPLPGPPPNSPPNPSPRTAPNPLPNPLPGPALGTDGGEAS